MQYSERKSICKKIHKQVLLQQNQDLEKIQQLSQLLILLIRLPEEILKVFTLVKHMMQSKLLHMQHLKVEIIFELILKPQVQVTMEPAEFILSIQMEMWQVQVTKSVISILHSLVQEFGLLNLVFLTNKTIIV